MTQPPRPSAAALEACDQEWMRGLFMAINNVDDWNAVRRKIAAILDAFAAQAVAAEREREHKKEVFRELEAGDAGRIAGRPIPAASDPDEALAVEIEDTAEALQLVNDILADIDRANTRRHGIAVATRTLAAALAERGRVEPQWHPIDTAPKDQDILVCDARTNGFHQVVCWDDERDDPPFRWATSDGPTFHEKAFTHWQPLAPPPSAIRRQTMRRSRGPEASERPSSTAGLYRS